MESAAAISMPRLCFSDHIWCLLDTFKAEAIPLDRSQDPFWHHGLTLLFEKMLKNNVEWIITTDYDTLFNETILEKMLEIVTAHDEIDALSVKQIMRNTELLIGLPAERTKGGLTRMRQAHFGLTLIRAIALADVPKPWFHEVPDKNGGWSRESTKADTYFWRNWEQAGKTLYQVDDLSIGHLELLVTWPAEGGGVIHQPVQEWRRTKKPPKGAIGT